MSSLSEKLLAYDAILKPALDKLRHAFVKAVNKGGDIAELSTAIEELRQVRQIINDAENIGFGLGIGQFVVITFPLTDDPEKNCNQMGIHPLKDELD